MDNMEQFTAIRKFNYLKYWSCYYFHWINCWAVGY